jgi:Na+/alanine symporter
VILAWLAFHVVVGGLNSLAEEMPHIVLLLAIGYVLLGPPTSKYFQRARNPG